jgi:hypothetical protein
MMANPFPEYTTRPADIYGNMFESTSRKLQGLLGLSGPNAERKALLKAYKEARSYGIDSRAAREIGQQAVEDVRVKAQKGVEKWGKRGEGAGRFAESLGTAGKGLERAAEGITGLVLKGVRAGAAGGRFGGRQMRRLGTINQPFELQELGRYGAEEAFNRTDTLPALSPYESMSYENYVSNQ